jgi:hypothetical protein
MMNKFMPKIPFPQEAVDKEMAKVSDLLEADIAKEEAALKEGDMKDADKVAIATKACANVSAKIDTYSGPAMDAVWEIAGPTIDETRPEDVPVEVYNKVKEVVKKQVDKKLKERIQTAIDDKLVARGGKPAEKKGGAKKEKEEGEEEAAEEEPAAEEGGE